MRKMPTLLANSRWISTFSWSLSRRLPFHRITKMDPSLSTVSQSCHSPPATQNSSGEQVSECGRTRQEPREFLGVRFGCHANQICPAIQVLGKPIFQPKIAGWVGRVDESTKIDTGFSPRIFRSCRGCPWPKGVPNRRRVPSMMEVVSATQSSAFAGPVRGCTRLQPGTLP